MLLLLAQLGLCCYFRFLCWQNSNVVMLRLVLRLLNHCAIAVPQFRPFLCNSFAIQCFNASPYGNVHTHMHTRKQLLHSQCLCIDDLELKFGSYCLPNSFNKKHSNIFFFNSYPFRWRSTLKVKHFQTVHCTVWQHTQKLRQHGSWPIRIDLRWWNYGSVEKTILKTYFIIITNFCYLLSNYTHIVRIYAIARSLVVVHIPKVLIKPNSTTVCWRNGWSALQRSERKKNRTHIVIRK